LHDDHAPLDGTHLTVKIMPLSALIMTRCPYQPSDIMEDPRRASLIVIRLAEDGHAQFNFTSLDRMADHDTAMPNRPHRIAGSLFDEPVFATVVLPALTSGATLIFR